MASRLSTFSAFPWTGGLNTALDESMIGPNQLTQADNITLGTQPTRLKRDGIDMDWDDLSVASTLRSSSGTSRTVTTTGHKWRVNDTLTISGAGNSNYNTTAGTVSAVTSTVTSTVTADDTTDKIAWTANGLSNSDEVIITTSGVMPAPLVSGRIYFVVSVATDDFKLALTPGGSAIDITTAGTGTHTARKALENVITYTFVGATSITEGSTADVGMVITVTTPIICLYDYWYGTTSAKTQRLMALSAAGQLYSINTTSGARTLITDAGTPYVIPTGGLTKSSIIAYENRLMIAVSGSTNVMKHYMPTAVSGDGVILDVENTSGYAATPKPDMLQVHMGRLMCNDKANPDRLHYCETGNYSIWQGAGDSGGFDIGQGDGDPQGITAIFPTFKGVLFVSKRTKLYRLDGYDISIAPVQRVSSSLGAVSHQGVAAVGQDDILFVSDRGVHSVVATADFGDFQGRFISKNIQKSFNQDWERSRLSKIQASWIPSYNSVAFSVAEQGDSLESHLWLFNVEQGEWYRWPDVACTALAVTLDSDSIRLYIGQDNGRVAQAMRGENSDVNSSGTEVPIVMRITTGRIYVDNNPTTSKAFKKLALIIRPKGNVTLTASIKIDNFSTQSLSFTSEGASNLLGSTFVLGESVLGVGLVTDTYMQSIDGYGRGFKLSIVQTGVVEFGEILGYQVLFELAEYAQENRAGDAS
jgi:hypothetical protein